MARRHRERIRHAAQPAGRPDRGPHRPPTLAGQLAATAQYLSAVQDWSAQTRSGLAGAIADCLGSRQAVSLCTGGPAQAALAAADIAAHVLDAIWQSLTQGEQIAVAAAALTDAYPATPGGNGRFGPPSAGEPGGQLTVGPA